MFKKYTLLYLAFLVLYALIDLHGGNTFYAGTYTFSLLVFLVSFVIVVLSLIIGLFSKKSRSAIKYYIVFCLGIFLEIIIVDRIANYQASKTKLVGDEIVASILNAYEKEGEYLDSLDLYVPEHLDDIPPHYIGFRGYEFNYYKFSPEREDGFELNFLTRYGGIYRFYSNGQNWILSD